MAKHKSYNGVCVFCGKASKVTNDHIPPKTVFAKPRPSDLITVPGCKKCNHGFSKDEEYFRTTLCLSDRTSDEKNAIAGREAAMRSIQRKNASGFIKAILTQTFLKEDYTPSGIYLGTRLGFNVDLERVHKVVKKTVRGLFYHETGRILPQDYDIAVDSQDTLEAKGLAYLSDLQKLILGHLVEAKERRIGGSAFRYRFVIPNSGTGFLSAWLLIFYDEVPFICLSAQSSTVIDSTEV